MKEIDALTSIGLSPQEATVYLASLTLGPAAASAIAKEAQLKRTTVYPILKSLAKRGAVIVSFRKNERFYHAQRPQKLAQQYEKQLSVFNEFIPSLNRLEKKHAQLVGIRFIETTDELHRFYDDVLVEYKGKQYDVIGNARSWEMITPEYFKDYRRKRAALKITTRILLTEDSRPVNPTDAKLLRIVKYLPAPYTFKSIIDIYKDKILVVTPELTSLAVVIEIPAMTDIFKNIFSILWETTA